MVLSVHATETHDNKQQKMNQNNNKNYKIDNKKEQIITNNKQELKGRLTWLDACCAGRWVDEWAGIGGPIKLKCSWSWSRTLPL